MQSYKRLRKPSPAPERPDLFGREKETAELMDALTRKRRIIVHGPSGVGTTSVVLTAAERARERGLTQRTVYLSVASTADAGWIVDATGVSLEGPAFIQRPRQQRLPALLSALSKEATFVIWDHVDRPLREPWSEPSWGGLRPLLQIGVEVSQAAKTRLMIVSEQAHLKYKPYESSRCVENVAVGPIGTTAATELVEAHGGSYNSPSADPLSAATSYPLALRLLARSRPPQGSLGGDETRADPIAQALEQVWRQATDETRKALLDLSVVQDGGSEACCRALCELDADAWSELVQEMEAAGMVARSSAGDADSFVELHDRLLRFLRSKSPGGPSDEAVERHRQIYFDRAHAWAAESSPSYAGLLLKELPNLLMSFARSLGDDRDRTAALVDALQEVLGQAPPEAPTLIARVLRLAQTLGATPAATAETSA